MPPVYCISLARGTCSVVAFILRRDQWSCLLISFYVFFRRTFMNHHDSCGWYQVPHQLSHPGRRTGKVGVSFFKTLICINAFGVGMHRKNVFLFNCWTSLWTPRAALFLYQLQVLQDSQYLFYLIYCVNIRWQSRSLHKWDRLFRDILRLPFSHGAVRKILTPPILPLIYGMIL